MSNEWWKKEIAYQIYPKSFKDSNGDGIGDLRGIIEKLDYLKDLGVTLLWLCPIYKSPMDDNGYDISDYYDINPEFGTMADLEELIEKLRTKDVLVIYELDRLGKTIKGLQELAEYFSLKNIDMVGTDFKIEDSGGGCGKGEQWPLPTTESGPHMRIRNITVGGEA